MKHLLLIWIFSGSLDGFSQTVPSNDIRYLIQAPDGSFSIRKPDDKTDTLRSVLLVTGKPPAFMHAVNGFCVVRNGEHVGHLDSRQRLFKLPVRVWQCEGIYPKKQG